MIIFVKTLSGKTIQLDVSDTDTVGSIKAQIAKKEKVPVDTQRIVFGGKDLEDDKILVDCGVKKESILNLIIKASEKNLSQYSETRRKELHVAQTSMKVTQYYNPTAGLQDELESFRDSESKFDQFQNPQGAEYDLGKDGEFKEFVILLGTFVRSSFNAPIDALLRKGFRVISTDNEKTFVDNLPHVDIAWIISAAAPNGSYGGVGYFRAYQKVSKEQFVNAVDAFHKRGGGLFIWGDNDPLFEHANAVLPCLLKDPSVQLVGDTPGDKTLKLGDGNKTGYFGAHIIFTGILSLYEGVTICYPKTLGCLQVLATSTDKYPVICCADNEALKDNTVGRIIVDCGYTKNYTSWDAAGSARYIINATIWLLGLEHRELHNMPIEGKNKNHDYRKYIDETHLKIHTPENTPYAPAQQNQRNQPTRPMQQQTQTTTSSSYDPYGPPQQQYQEQQYQIPIINEQEAEKPKRSWWPFGRK